MSTDPLDELKDSIALIEVAGGLDAAELEESLNLPDQVQALKERLIVEAVRKHQWNISAASDELGISRQGLTKMLRKLKLQRPKKGCNDR